MSAGPCRNASTIQSEHRGPMLVCPCSPEMDGACACTPLASVGSDRNLCGCWPEPYAAPVRRTSCRCGASLTSFERRHGLQCRTCTNRDESLYGSGCGL